MTRFAYLPGLLLLLSLAACGRSGAPVAEDHPITITDAANPNANPNANQDAPAPARSFPLDFLLK